MNEGEAAVADRFERLQRWAGEQLDWPGVEPVPASEDASFRRYFRVQRGEQSYIVMDAPPEQEDCAPFVHVTGLFRSLGLHVPEILASDLSQGFLLLADLGTRLYLDELDEDSVERLYGDALGALAALQVCAPEEAGLPPYDRRLLLAEMGLFRDWLLGTHLGLQLDGAQQQALDQAFARLADSALEQPQVCVHRDYHSRNLMRCSPHNPGILDYQDAVVGPLSYDLVSLLRDCYIAWPRQRVEDWALGYFELAQQTGILRPEDADEQRFLRWFDWMGVQRHLKAAGIFARLDHRDGKPGYLADIPRTLGYVTEVCSRYPELGALGGITEQVLERL
ncbi:MAG TPA: aminoglycoside phosphotransferase [Gammaproteobacteria bacterium]|nr:aminoglycoside phosphotransferase [Gammaproteobacteria bacterium]